MLGLGAPACSKFQTARECGSFVETIRVWKAQPPTLAASAAASGAAAASVESRLLAERYDELARRIDGLHLESAELAPRAGRYQKLAREAGRALRDVAETVEKGDAEAGHRRRAEFEEIAGGEAALVTDINTICR